MKARILIILGIAIMISFVTGWQIGISTFYYTNEDNVKPAKRSYLLPPDTLFTSMEYEELGGPTHILAEEYWPTLTRDIIV